MLRRRSYKAKDFKSKSSKTAINKLNKPSNFIPVIHSFNFPPQQLIIPHTHLHLYMHLNTFIHIHFSPGPLDFSFKKTIIYKIIKHFNRAMNLIWVSLENIIFPFSKIISIIFCLMWIVVSAPPSNPIHSVIISYLLFVHINTVQQKKYEKWYEKSINICKWDIKNN